MYWSERNSVEAVLNAALCSRTDEFRLRLCDVFRQNGYQALSLSREPRPDLPSVVVFEDPAYAVIYLFTEPAMNEAEYEVFRKEARAFAWAHGAAAYFVRLDRGAVTRETD